MRMRMVDRKEYNRTTEAVPDHDGRVVEQRRPGRLYYVSQCVYAPNGQLVAQHDENGTCWVVEPD